MLLLQVLQLVFAQAQVVQFFELVAEQLVTGPLFVAGIGQALQFEPRLVPALGRHLHLPGQVDGPGVFVEQAPMGIGLEQGLVLVLAVDVDQQLAQGLEVAEGTGRAVDVATAAAFGSDDAPQDAQPVAGQVAFGQPGVGLGNVDQVEGGEDVGLVGAGAYHAAVGAVAQGQAQGIEHDRLARTCLARDHGHAAGDFQVEVFDDGVVVNGQVHQHEGDSRKSCLVIYTVVFSSLPMPFWRKRLKA